MYDCLFKLLALMMLFSENKDKLGELTRIQSNKSFSSQKSPSKAIEQKDHRSRLNGKCPIGYVRRYTQEPDFWEENEGDRTGRSPITTEYHRSRLDRYGLEKKILMRAIVNIFYFHWTFHWNFDWSEIQWVQWSCASGREESALTPIWGWHYCHWWSLSIVALPVELYRPTDRALFLVFHRKTGRCRHRPRHHSRHSVIVVAQLMIRGGCSSAVIATTNTRTRSNNSRSRRPLEKRRWRRF